MEASIQTACSTPKCGREATHGRFCKPCADNLARIRKELTADPKLLYQQRGAVRKRRTDYSIKKRNPKSTPTCCVPGCFNERVPPSPYCDLPDHQEWAGGD